MVALWFSCVEAQQKVIAHFLFVPDYGMSKDEINAYEPLMPGPSVYVNFPSSQSLALGRFRLETRYKELLQSLDVSQLKAKRDGIVILGVGNGATAALTATATSRLAFLKALVVESPVDPLARALIDYGQQLFDKNPENSKALQLVTEALSDPGAWYASTGLATTQPLPDVYPISSIEHIDRNLPVLLVVRRNDIFYRKNGARLLYIKLKQAGHPNVYLLDLEDILGDSAVTSTHVYVEAVHAFYKKYDIPYDILLATEGQQYLAQAQPSIESIEQTILRSYVDNAFAQKVLLGALTAGIAFPTAALGIAAEPVITKAIRGAGAPEAPQVPPAPGGPAAGTSWSDMLKSVYNTLASKFKGSLFFGKAGGPSEASGFLVPTTPQAKELFELHVPADIQQPIPSGTLTDVIKQITEQQLNALNNEVRGLADRLQAISETADEAALEEVQREIDEINKHLTDLPVPVRLLIEGTSLEITTEAEENTRAQLSPQARSYIEQITQRLRLIKKHLNTIKQRIAAQYQALSSAAGNVTERAANHAKLYLNFAKKYQEALNKQPDLSEALDLRSFWRSQGKRQANTSFAEDSKSLDEMIEQVKEFIKSLTGNSPLNRDTTNLLRKLTNMKKYLTDDYNTLTTAMAIRVPGAPTPSEVKKKIG